MRRTQQFLFCLLPLLCALLLGGCGAQAWEKAALGDICYSVPKSWYAMPVRTESGKDDSTESIALKMGEQEDAYIALFYYDREKAPEECASAQAYYQANYKNPGSFLDFKELASQTVEGEEVLHLSFWPEPEDLEPYYVEQYLVDSPKGLCVVSLSCHGENKVASALLERVIKSIHFQDSPLSQNNAGEKL